jgi:hypothetical protein
MEIHIAEPLVYDPSTSEFEIAQSSILNKEKLPEQWKKPVVVPIRRKGDNCDCSD